MGWMEPDAVIWTDKKTGGFIQKSFLAQLLKSAVK